VAQEYGGRGKGFMEQLIFNDEMIPGPDTRTDHVIGLAWRPVVIAHGTEGRSSDISRLSIRRRNLVPGVQRANAGSDCPDTDQSRGQRDHYLVKWGQKVWTTLAHARSVMLLTRERNEANPRHGLTYLLVDMESPGVEGDLSFRSPGTRIQ